MKKYFNRIWIWITIDILSFSLSMASLSMMPYVTKLLFDGHLTLSLLEISILYSILIFLYLLFAYFANRLQWKYGIIFEESLKKDFFHYVISLPTKAFHSKKVSDYASIQATDIVAITQDYLPPFIDLFKSAITIIIYGVAVILTVGLKYAIVLVVLSTLSIWIPKLQSKSLARLREVWSRQNKKYLSKMQDLFGGYNFVDKETIMSIEGENEKFLKSVSKAQYSFGKTRSMALIVSALSVDIIKLIIFIMIGFDLLNQSITVGVGVALLAFVEAFTGPLKALLYDFNALNSVKSIKERFIKMITSTNDNFDSTHDFTKMSVTNGLVKIDHFNLYVEQLDIEKGKKYAVIGKNGSGKSTLLKLFTNEINLVEGYISVNGEVYDTTRALDFIGYISQHSHIFSDTYKNNVTVFKSYQDKEDFIQRIDFLKREKIINNPDSSLLSGGEKAIIDFQRLSNMSKSMWILDEPLAAMDKETQQNTISYLAEQDTTIIMVTHHLDESLSIFDEIILMNHGKIETILPYSEISKLEAFKQLKKKN